MTMAKRLLRIFTVVAIPVLAAGQPARADPASGPAAATPWVKLHAARARMIADAGKTASGARLAGLEVELDDGWKTYWRMPGDAGVPPQLAWEGSSNVASIKVRYPAPMRMQEPGGEVVGYKSALLLPIEVAPKDPSKPVDLRLALEIGVCRDICVPATASFALAVPPPSTTAPGAAIAAALGQVPRQEAARQASDPELRSVAIEDGDSGPRLAVTAAFHGANADLFVEAPEGIYVPMPQREGQGQGPDGIVRFVTDLPGDVARDLKGKTLTLTLVSDAGATEAQRTLPR